METREYLEKVMQDASIQPLFRCSAILSLPFLLCQAFPIAVELIITIS